MLAAEAFDGGDLDASKGLDRGRAGADWLTIGMDRRIGKVLWEAEAPYKKLEKIHSISSYAAGTPVTEEYLMAMERKAFCGLLTHPKTQERIMGMMSTGKPVRN